MNFTGDLIYLMCFTIILSSVLGVIINKDYFKKIICLGVMQAGVIIFFVIIAYVDNAKTPFLYHAEIVNPLPHVLMLTAIVVGLALTAVGLSMSYKYKNINENEEQ